MILPATALVSWLACQESSPPRSVLTATHEGQALVLSHSLNAAGTGGVFAIELSADLTLGAPGARGDEILQLVDVTTWEDGRIAVLDRMARQVHVYDVDGRFVQSLGARGEGPGEFSSPYALTTLGNAVAVWDANASRVFTVVSETGDPVATAPRPVSGDWAHIPFRLPIWFDGRFQMPLEDITRRFSSDSDSTFIHQVQPDERWPAIAGEDFHYEDAPSVLIRYDRQLQVVDTAATLRAPPSERVPADPRSYPQFFQPIWSGRPLWAAGDGFIAVAQGDSAEVRVTITGSEVQHLIVWPNDRRPISETEYRHFVEWMRIEEGKRLTDEDKARFMPKTRREQEARVRESLEDLIFATDAPSITGILAAGPCLFLEGFDPTANPRGRGLTLVVVDVRGDSLLGAVSVPRVGSRVRHIGAGALFSSYVDDDGVIVLERYPLPEGWCRT